MKILEKLINENLTINWSEVEKIPEFNRLKECNQNPKWHSEGNAFIHTQKVVEAMEKEISTKEWLYPNKNMVEKARPVFFYTGNPYIMLGAALFHDIGKGVTTRLGKDGNWHQYGHEIEGEKITRKILWDEDICVRETICALVRYHMEPLKILKTKAYINNIIKIGGRVSWADLITLKRCDNEGSIQINGGTKGTDKEMLDILENITCDYPMNTHYRIPMFEAYSSIKEHKYSLKSFLDRKLPWEVSENRLKVTLMIGIPGSGKSTYVEKHKNNDDFVILSRDKIRIDLGYCKENEKYFGNEIEEGNVTKVFNEELLKAANLGKRIIIDNTNIKKGNRFKIKEALKKFDIEWEYIYIESPTFGDNVDRRDGQISKEILTDMALNFEWPEPDEYDIFKIIKQIENGETKEIYL